MLKNMLKVKIEENEKVYTDGKAALEEIISKANSEYNKLLNEYKTRIQNVKNDSMLTDEGKRDKGTKLHEEYLKKAKDAAAKYVNQLQDKNTDIIKAIEEEKVKNNEILKGQKMPQIIYVSCMMNNINQLQDVPMLKEVFDYACLEDNFSSEVMNLIYLKANSLLNTLNNSQVKIVDETQSKAQERVINQEGAINNTISDSKLITTLQAILTEINKFKHDYIYEFKEFEHRFKSWLSRGEYPRNLIIAADIRRDFALDNKLNKNDPWNQPKKSTNPWVR